MTTFFVFLVILGILIVVHEFGHFIAARRVGVKVEKFYLGFGPKIVSKKKNDTEYGISAIPFGGYVKLAGDNPEEYKGNAFEYLAQSPGRRAQIIFFGPLLNYILGFLCFWLIFCTGYPRLTTKVGGLLDGFGAKDAGIEAGDKIIAVDGQRIEFWEDLQKAIQAKNTVDKVQISIIRDNKEYALEVRIREKPLEDVLGQKRNVGLLGITPADEVVTVKYGPVRSFALGLEKTLDLTVITYKAIWRMINRQMSFRDSVSGLPSIFKLTSQATESGLTAILYLIAALSISLAIFNLLPIPVLDGGHLFFLIIEKIRGRAMSLKAERIVTQIGITIIVSLAVFVNLNDLAKNYGDKIHNFFFK